MPWPWTACYRWIVRHTACLILLLLVACGSGRRQQPSKSATKSTAPSAGKIKVVDMLYSFELVKYVRPIYPKEARKARLQGVVRFRALITKTGEVSEQEVLSGDPGFVSAATAAVRQWRYKPCLLYDEPVEIRTTIDVPFTLNQ